MSTAGGPFTSQLLTAEELAEHLGVSKQRVYELARLGLLPCVRLGRAVRFATQAVEAWISSGGRPLPGGWRRIPGDDGAYR
jgi:excisionase family DNA binding protein